MATEAPIQKDGAVRVHLSFRNQPEDVLFTERRLVLSNDRPTIVIGRASKRTLDSAPAIDNALLESPVISKKHAELVFISEERLVYIKDSRSRHGTWLNSKKLIPGILHGIDSGDLIKFGTDIACSDIVHPPPSAMVEMFFSETPAEETFDCAQGTDDSADGAKAAVTRAPASFRVPDSSEDSDSDDIGDSDSGKAFDNEDEVDAHGISEALKLLRNQCARRQTPKRTEETEAPVTKSSDIIDVEAYVSARAHNSFNFVDLTEADPKHSSSHDENLKSVGATASIQASPEPRPEPTQSTKDTTQNKPDASSPVPVDSDDDSEVSEEEDIPPSGQSATDVMIHDRPWAAHGLGSPEMRTPPPSGPSQDAACHDHSDPLVEQPHFTLGDFEADDALDLGKLSRYRLDKQDRATEHPIAKELDQDTMSTSADDGTCEPGERVDPLTSLLLTQCPFGLPETSRLDAHDSPFKEQHQPADCTQTCSDLDSELDLLGTRRAHPIVSTHKVPSPGMLSHLPAQNSSSDKHTVTVQSSHPSERHGPRMSFAPLDNDSSDSRAAPPSDISRKPSLEDYQESLQRTQDGLPLPWFRRFPRPHATLSGISEHNHHQPRTALEPPTEHSSHGQNGYLANPQTLWNSLQPLAERSPVNTEDSVILPPLNTILSSSQRAVSEHEFFGSSVVRPGAEKQDCEELPSIDAVEQCKKPQGPKQLKETSEANRFLEQGDESRSVSGSDGGSVSDSDSDSEFESEADSEAGSEAVSEADTEAVSEADTEAEAGFDTESGADLEIEDQDEFDDDECFVQEDDCFEKEDEIKETETLSEDALELAPGDSVVSIPAEWPYDDFLARPPKITAAEADSAPGLDMTSAYQFEQSKLVAQQPAQQRTHGTPIAEDVASKPTTPKRKADEISQLSPVEAMADKHSADEAAYPTAAPGVPVALSTTTHLTDNAKEPSMKRLKSAVGYFAMGSAAAGMAIFTGLVATAPTFT